MDVMAGRPEAEQQKLFGENTRRVYRLDDGMEMD